MTATGDSSSIHNSVLGKEELVEIIDLSPLTIYCCGPGPQFPTTYMSSNVTEQLGYQPQDYYDDPLFWTKCIHPDDVKSVLAFLNRVENDERIIYEYRMRHADGHYLWLHDEVRPLYAKDKKTIRGLVGSWIDISEMRSAKTDLEKAHAELETIYSSAPIGLGFIDTDLRFVRLNERLADIDGVPLNEHLGRKLQDVIPEIAAQVVPVYRKIFATGEPVQEMEISGTTPADPGVPKTWLTSYSPVKLADNTIIGVNTVVSDITKLNKVLEELHKYRQIVSATPDLISYVDAQYTYRVVNDAYLSAHLRTREDLIDHHVSDVLGKEAFETIVKPRFDRCLAGESMRFQEWFDFAGLGRRFTDVHYNPSVDTDGNIQGVAVSVRDMTEHKRAEDELRESRFRLERIANTIEDVIWVTDWQSKTILFVSPAYEKVWGRSVQRAYENPQEWLDAVHDEDHPRVQKALAAMERGERYDEVYRILRPDGSQRWIRDRGYSAFDEQTGKKEAIGIAQDVTERIEADERRLHLESALGQAQKMEAVGQLAAGMAHDVNSLLMVILGNAELGESALVKARPGHLNQVSENLQNITLAVERGKKMIDQLLALGRTGAHNPATVSLNDVVENARLMLAQFVGNNIDLHVRCQPNLSLCRVDAQQISRSIINLAMNARDAMPRGGTLRIETADVQLATKDRIVIGIKDEGPFVMLTVADTGTGIEAAIIERIFEPFFTTKPVDKGSGLGLSVVHGIIGQNGGYIVVDSKIAEGTTFRLYFPAID